MRRVLLLFVGSLALAGVAVATSGGATQAQPRWVITDLGTLGGKWSEAVAINAQGQIVGSSELKATTRDGYSIQHALLWEHGVITDLGTLGGRDSAALAINDHGQVVGWSYYKGGGPRRHAFLWERGRMIDLGVLPGDHNSRAVALNEHGQVVGWSTNNDVKHAFLWENGKRTALGTFGSEWSYVAAINDAGQIVGSSQSTTGRGGRAFMWQDGRMHDLGAGLSEGVAINARGQIVGWKGSLLVRDILSPERAFLWQSGRLTWLGTRGFKMCWPEAINDAGQIVGERRTRAGYGLHAFLWQSGRLRDLGTLPGDGPAAFSLAEAINSAGQVAGRSTVRPKDKDIDPITHAFLWQRGTMADLGALPGLPFSWATDLNDSAQIVGVSGRASWGGGAGVYHAVLWTLKR